MRDLRVIGVYGQWHNYHSHLTGRRQRQRGHQQRSRRILCRWHRGGGFDLLVRRKLHSKRDRSPTHRERHVVMFARLLERRLRIGEWTVDREWPIVGCIRTTSSSATS